TAVVVRSSWSVTNVPPTGLTDITVPLTIVQTNHTSGFMLAQQFGFVGVESVDSVGGYIGLEPRRDHGGKSILHATFASSVPGTTTTDANCCRGA
ncbi:hypothetical protein C8F04DRAFT_934670, partial [Mycena alexandri]